MFICEAFKSHTEWNNAQHVNYDTNNYSSLLELFWSCDIEDVNEHVLKYYKTFDS